MAMRSHLDISRALTAALRRLARARRAGDTGAEAASLAEAQALIMQLYIARRRLGD